MGSLTAAPVLPDTCRDQSSTQHTKYTQHSQVGVHTAARSLHETLRKLKKSLEASPHSLTHYLSLCLPRRGLSKKSPTQRRSLSLSLSVYSRARGREEITSAAPLVLGDDDDDGVGMCVSFTSLSSCMRPASLDSPRGRSASLLRLSVCLSPPRRGRNTRRARARLREKRRRAAAAAQWASIFTTHAECENESTSSTSSRARERASAVCGYMYACARTQQAESAMTTSPLGPSLPLHPPPSPSYSLPHTLYITLCSVQQQQQHCEHIHNVAL